MAAVNAQRFIDALWHLEETGDVEPMAALYVSGASISNPLTAHAHEGPDGARQFWSAYRAAFKSVHSEFRHVIENDAAALLEWTSKGTGPDAQICYGGVSVLEFGQDGLTAFRTYFDSRQVGNQMVAQPTAKGLANN